MTDSNSNSKPNGAGDLSKPSESLEKWELVGGVDGSKWMGKVIDDHDGEVTLCPVFETIGIQIGCIPVPEKTPMGMSLSVQWPMTPGGNLVHVLSSPDSTGYARMRVRWATRLPLEQMAKADRLRIVRALDSELEKSRTARRSTIALVSQ